MQTATADLVALAKATTRDEFVQKHPHYFLVGETALEPPSASRKTEAFPSLNDTDPGEWEGGEYTEVRASGTAPPRLFVVAICKVQSDWPSMITVGRTRNNDIVLNDASVSKFHAYFRLVDDHIELCDAGSLVGTWVGETRLAQKGVGVRVSSGQKVRFAHHEFQVLDAGDCWTRLRAQARSASGSREPIS